MKGAAWPPFLYRLTPSRSNDIGAEPRAAWPFHLSINILAEGKKIAEPSKSRSRSGGTPVPGVSLRFNFVPPAGIF
jgi:hypothetical protein